MQMITSLKYSVKKKADPLGQNFWLKAKKKKKLYTCI